MGSNAFAHRGGIGVRKAGQANRAIVIARRMYPQRCKAVGPLHRPLADIDMLDAAKGDDGIAVEQMAMHNAQPVGSNIIAPIMVSTVWQDDNAICRDDEHGNQDQPKRQQLEGLYHYRPGKRECGGDRGRNPRHPDMAGIELSQYVISHDA